MNINILLAAEGNEYQNTISDIIKKIFDSTKIFLCSSKDEAVAVASKELIDIFIIDIELKESDGLDLAKEIRKFKKYFLTPIIIVTSYEKLRLTAYEEIRCFVFIYKDNLWKINLKKTLLFIATNIEPIKKRKVKITCADKTIILIDKDKIIYFESKDHRVIMGTQDHEYELKYITLSNLEKILGEYFIQCHRSYIVNMHHIKRINFKTNTIGVNSTKMLIPIGRFYKENTQKYFFNYVQKVK